MTTQPIIHKIRIHSKILKAFKQRAWKAYPVEHIEAMHGIPRNDGGFDIYAFTPVEHRGTIDYVNYVHDPELQHDTSEEIKTIFLGYIHTHIGKRTCEHLSFHDCIDTQTSNEILTGVALIYISRGRRFSVFHFERPRPPMVLEISNI